MKFLPRAYTPEEDAILRKHYPKMGFRIAKLIPNRTLDSIRRRARTLGIKVDATYTDWSLTQRREPDPTPEEIRERAESLYRQSIEASRGYDRLLRYGEYAQ